MSSSELEQKGKLEIGKLFRARSLRHLDEVKNAINEYSNIETAIWFHDVIYEPTKDDNEDKSAEYAKNFLESIKVDSSEIEKIEYLIQLTKHPSNPENSDEKYLMDIDLSILGANMEHYDKYELGIRKEYATVPSFQYRIGRKKILNSFLKLNSIYHTNYFQKKYEVQARANINRALHKL